MKEKFYKVIFKIDGLDTSTFKDVPELKEFMESEIMRVYNMYANKTNNGLTKKLNEEFEHVDPGYFEMNKGKEWYDLTEYNKFIADGYQRLVVDDFNKTNVSPLLDFYVEAKEIVFTGYLKVDRNVTINFSLKEV
jgi:hypothetical protein